MGKATRDELLGYYADEDPSLRVDPSLDLTWSFTELLTGANEHNIFHFAAGRRQKGVAPLSSALRLALARPLWKQGDFAFAELVDRYVMLRCCSAVGSTLTAKGCARALVGSLRLEGAITMDIKLNQEALRQAVEHLERLDLSSFIPLQDKLTCATRYAALVTCGEMKRARVPAWHKLPGEQRLYWSKFSPFGPWACEQHGPPPVSMLKDRTRHAGRHYHVDFRFGRELGRLWVSYRSNADLLQAAAAASRLPSVRSTVGGGEQPHWHRLVHQLQL